MSKWLSSALARPAEEGRRFEKGARIREINQIRYPLPVVNQIILGRGKGAEEGGEEGGEKGGEGRGGARNGGEGVAPSGGEAVEGG